MHAEPPIKQRATAPAQPYVRSGSETGRCTDRAVLYRTVSIVLCGPYSKDYMAYKRDRATWTRNVQTTERNIRNVTNGSYSTSRTRRTVHGGPYKTDCTIWTRDVPNETYGLCYMNGTYSSDRIMR